MKVWVKGLVDILLECCRCICESKGHDQGFKEAIAGASARFPEIIISYPNKAIGIANVGFGDVIRFGLLGQCFSDQWQRVSVLYSFLNVFLVGNAGS
jgi:hypothetical protein